MDINLKKLAEETANQEPAKLCEYIHKNPSIKNARDDEGRNLLYYYCINESYELIKVLLELDAYPLVYDCNGMSTLAIAAGCKDHRIFDVILKHAKHIAIAEDIELAYVEAVVIPRLENIRVLLDCGYPCNISYRSSPIMKWAIQSDSLEVFQLLYSNGADVNATVEDGETALYSAAAEGKLDIVKFLVEHGAKVDAVVGKGVTAISIACCYGQKEVAEYLIRSGANINHSTQEGLTPLFYAIWYGYREIVEILLLNGANWEAKDSKERGIEYYLKKCKKKWRKEMEGALSSYFQNKVL